MDGWGGWEGRKTMLPRSDVGYLHKVTFISNLLWLIRWGTPQEHMLWCRKWFLVHLMALSDGCRANHYHNAKRNSSNKLGAFPSNGIRDLDSNHPLSQVQSCHGLIVCHGLLRLDDSLPWGQITSPSELNFTLTVVHTHTGTHTTHLIQLSV